MDNEGASGLYRIRVNIQEIYLETKRQVEGGGPVHAIISSAK